MSDIRGWAFPIQADNGRIKEVSGEEIIHQSIEMILLTNLRERFYYSNFGSTLRNFIFDSIDYTILKQIEHDLETAILLWEQRIETVKITAKESKESINQILIDIEYRLYKLDTEFHYNYTMEMG